MDDSQSSDFLSESTDIFLNSPTDSATAMNNETYELLLSNTKTSFSNIRKYISKPTFSSNFCSLLEDCGSCINQSLDLISSLLTESDVKVKKLVEYMDHALCLLQLLTDFIKDLIELMSMSCNEIKRFPIVTGHIITIVFTHCKDSEIIYGTQLGNVQKQIKDLFRTCHELQSTYLMVLEKHYIFDLTQKEEEDILLEVLDINLKIGEIVQSLDVKTMAEQWKAYTVLCEKYCNNLLDKHVYSDSTKILCNMITNNINTALESNQEEKVILRSLKVSSFTLKILLRVCITLKQSVVKDYNSIMELLLFVKLNNEAYLHTIAEKNEHFINLYNNNIMAPINTLLGELLYDDELLQFICNYNLEDIKYEDKLLGYIILIISMIKSLLQKGGDELAKLKKHKIVNAIYSCLPYCHVWFNMSLYFKCEEIDNTQYHSYGLYEHLLTHTATLTCMMISEEINILEKRMVEALLGTKSLSAMFTSNLWVILARMSSRQLVLSQVTSLCQIYQKMDNNKLFNNSPQKVHLVCTISRLFQDMVDEDKLKICSMFNVRDDANRSLWFCLKICNLPKEALFDAEEVILDQFRIQMQKLIVGENDDIHDVIQLMNLASTCPYTNRDEDIEHLLLQAWAKACPENVPRLVKQLHRGNYGYYKYVEALSLLTESMIKMFHGNGAHLVQVIHIISNIVQAGSQELKFLVISILCQLANIETNDPNKHIADQLFTKTFTELFENNPIIRSKLFKTLTKYNGNNLLRIKNIANKDAVLKDQWTHYIKHGTMKQTSLLRLKEQLYSTMDNEYCHKCLEQIVDLTDTGSLTSQKTLSNNFDLIDIETLFEDEGEKAYETEPVCKKPKLEKADATEHFRKKPLMEKADETVAVCKNTKLNYDEADDIISRLESDTKLLCKIKENLFTPGNKKRLKTVCNKLMNIFD